MSDIVERLRVWPLRRGYSEVSIRRTMRDAADEIEKLRAEIKRLKAGGCARDQSTTQFCAEAVALKAEIEKLRAALGEKE